MSAVIFLEYHRDHLETKHAEKRCCRIVQGSNTIRGLIDLHEQTFAIISNLHRCYSKPWQGSSLRTQASSPVWQKPHYRLLNRSHRPSPRTKTFLIGQTYNENTADWPNLSGRQAGVKPDYSGYSWAYSVVSLAVFRLVWRGSYPNIVVSIVARVLIGFSACQGPRIGQGFSPF